MKQDGWIRNYFVVENILISCEYYVFVAYFVSQTRDEIRISENESEFELEKFHCI